MSEYLTKTKNVNRSLSRLVSVVFCLTVAAMGVAGLSGRADAQVVSEQKVSALAGGLTDLLHDSDGYGGAITNIGDVDGDLVDDLAVGAQGDDVNGTDRGAVWILFMNSNGTVRARQKIGHGAGGFTGGLSDGDGFGISVAGIGDLDVDGIPDLAVGAERDDEGGGGPNADWGAVWILFLNHDGTVKAHQKIADGQGGFSGPLDDNDHFGHSVTTVWDLDGGGTPDIVVGVPGDDDSGTNAGAVWVLFLDTNGTVSFQQKISSVDGGFGGVLLGDDNFGSSVAQVGDLDGDAVTELAVGASGDDTSGSEAGAVWILFLDTSGTVLSEQRISPTAALGAGDQFGSSVTYLGDHDVDGNEDIVVGAPGDGDGGVGRGAVWVVFLNDNGTLNFSQKISDTAGSFGGTLEDDDNFGSAVTWINDVNGDLVTDIVIGAINDDDGVDNAGAAWVVYLLDTGVATGYGKISQTEGSFSQLLVAGDWFGGSIARIGDLDNDGVDDLAIGAKADAGGGSTRGAVWVLFMNDDGTVRTHQKIGDDTGGFTGELDDLDQFGSSVTALMRLSPPSRCRMRSDR